MPHANAVTRNAANGRQSRAQNIDQQKSRNAMRVRVCDANDRTVGNGTAPCGAVIKRVTQNANRSAGKTTKEQRT